VVVLGIVAFGVGTIVSAIVGAVGGIVFAVLDIELLWAARSIVGAGSRE
jgi:hypothetical protein